MRPKDWQMRSEVAKGTLQFSSATLGMNLYILLHFYCTDEKYDI